jgi:hypothetical protein
MERRRMDKSVHRRKTSRSLAVAVMAGLASLLVACSSYGPGELRAGDSEAAVRQRMGQPTERVALAGGGHRLVYARGPMGYHTWMIDLAADGRVQSWHQALDRARFAEIRPGMPQAEVRSRLGPPAEQRALAFDGRRLWAWRFPTYLCEWFVVTLSGNGRVQDSGYVPDPRCDVDHD